MKPAYSMIIIAFIITITGIFYNNIYLNIISGLLLLIIILLLGRTSHRAKAERYDEEYLSQEELRKVRETSVKELNNIEEKIAEIKSKYEESISRTDNLHRLLTEFDLTAPIIEKLSTVIMKKSEESTSKKPSETQRVITNNIVYYHGVNIIK